MATNNNVPLKLHLSIDIICVCRKLWSMLVNFVEINKICNYFQINITLDI